VFSNKTTTTTMSVRPTTTINTKPQTPPSSHHNNTAAANILGASERAMPRSAFFLVFAALCVKWGSRMAAPHLCLVSFGLIYKTTCNL
jgi:hypothetical protein